ncbi:MotA/TolQ/ExbB proton channel family protein [Geopsychrobacter electrodiphilus]|uniref:MotA/TolQ/ExbB proton channel family protein n=1 Tax=Geopsychrobacter electrodiphilus TaxID=225196 RepID=UPI0003745765|nr:MotA/TolQ/ExbB proton channel family protein [Geopsychrobacter electrodiphilus]
MFELFKMGGALMYPILVCSIIALAIFFDRIWTYHSLKRSTAPLFREVERLIIAEHYEQALNLCHQQDTPMGRILQVALKHRGTSRAHIKTLVEEVGHRETASLERYLGLLGTIATIAPLLGLLGTVLGMIRAFNVMATQGVGTPATLGGGISEALLTTAAGLSLAVPTILLHKYLSSRVDRAILEMEEYSMQIVDLIGETR